MVDPSEVEAGFNAGSRDQWDGFAPHRRAVADLLAAGSGRLCVLGAGNANDLDLPGLLATYREVCLVDLDADALALGVGRQGVADDPRVRLVGGLDLTAMAGVVAGWAPATAVSDLDLTALAGWPAGRSALAIGGGFDAVASTCVLTQLVGSITRTLGERHPRFAEAVAAVRRGHLRLLVALARPGGSAWLITDLISSDRLPGLEALGPSGLAALFRRIEIVGGSIHGADPAAIARDFRGDPHLGGRIEGPDRPRTWLWKLHRRHYLVAAWRVGVRSVR